MRKTPAIPGLTERVGALSEGGWGDLLDQLRGTGLVARRSEHDPEAIDAHPLVREHFGQQLRATRPEAWRAGHGRLYEHLKKTAKPYPDTLAEMAPLYDAVAHGCAARKYQEAHELYRDRIQRKEEYFSGDKLGALGADLAALSYFFAAPWTEVVTELKGDPTEGFVLYEAGFYLRGLGRTWEALGSVQKGLDVAIASEDWREASIRARLLNQIYLLLGDIPNALRVAQQAVKVADKSEDAFQRALNRSVLADIWHQAGELTKAEVLFKESDDIGKTVKSTFQA